MKNVIFILYSYQLKLIRISVADEHTFSFLTVENFPNIFRKNATKSKTKQKLEKYPLRFSGNLTDHLTNIDEGFSPCCV